MWHVCLLFCIESDRRCHTGDKSSNRILIQIFAACIVANMHCWLTWHDIRYRVAGIRSPGVAEFNLNKSFLFSLSLSEFLIVRACKVKIVTGFSIIQATYFRFSKLTMMRCQCQHAYAYQVSHTANSNRWKIKDLEKYLRVNFHSRNFYCQT